jgi:nucleotide-binding universal stress UspA family protein
MWRLDPMGRSSQPACDCPSVDEGHGATTMIRIKSVLCPVDFSEISQHALDHAASIARWYDARLTMLYVFPNLPVLDLPPLVLEPADRERLIDRMRRMAVHVSDVPLDVRVQQAGFIHEEILAQLKATAADLLVLGTHGRSGFQRLFLGSVTEKVIRKACCPTLVVPPRAPDVSPTAPVRFRRILCPVDFSESSLRALAHAITMAEEADAHLVLLHVVEMPTVISPEPAALDIDLAGIREAAVTQTRQQLHDLIPDAARTYCTVETAVVQGSSHREILRQANQQGSDLIVMGVHGRGAVDMLLFGSTTHHVIRGSACPVLIVRGVEAPFDAAVS